VAGTLNSAAPFSIAAASSGASTVPRHTERLWRREPHRLDRPGNLPARSIQLATIRKAPTSHRIRMRGLPWRRLLSRLHNGAPFPMRKIVDLALAVGAALAAIAPALAAPQLSAECPEVDRLRAAANSVHEVVDLFDAKVRDEKVVAEENKYFVRFDAEKTITLSGTVKEFKFSAPRAGIILNVVNGEAQPTTWVIEMNPPAGLLRLGWRSKTLTPGMPVTLTIHPLRDDSNGGQFLTATLPDGRLMDGGPPATTQHLLQKLRDQAAAADRAVAEFLQRSGCAR
jgi:hypothetical protein